ncbi:MAG: hypothetical protein ABIK26_03870 [Candidatus Omnitrophota bacterium]|nr:hypothetical protein [Candidatus Omnitrophota bacterium]MBU1524236.1 hypothetical protein [Candidatus Omnitrophota bacterium]MBU2436686.1 hypothetical protein [Candidatus Omnitrophota bacterium]MBU2504699.1 hypothetical protein [Candidatus Omnitrophota bacterium]
MREKDCKIISVLFVLFILDLIKPFSYSLRAEFLFLGIIFLSLNYRFWFSFVLSIIFGYLKDSFGLEAIPLNLIEFSLFSALIHYFLLHFHKIPVRIFIVFAAIIIHIVLQAAHIRRIFPLFSLLFFIHSSLIFFLINYLLKKWIRISSAEYI